MSLILNESVVLAKTRSQDLKSVLKLNCWGSGIKDVSLVRQLVNVEIIGLSCNEITTLEDFAYCKKLKELILRKNKIKNIAEVAHLQKLPNLTSLWLGENPCVETTYNYRKVVLKALPQLKVLDNQPVTREELQEIEELGDEIYEEVPYESTTSSHSSSGPPSHGANNGNKAAGSAASQQKQQPSFETQPQQQHDINQQPSEPQHQHQNQNQQQLAISHCDQSFNEMSLYQPTQEYALNETLAGNEGGCGGSGASQRNFPRMLHNQSQGSLNALNSNSHNGNNMSQQFPGWSNSNVNNNNSIQMLPKGGKIRNANILSAVLCLVKELDYVSCEVVKNALHCRMEETTQ